MPILKNFIIKDFEDVQPGELVAVDVGGRALAIAMGQDRDRMQMHLLLLASPFEAAHPCWMTLNMVDSAISYGSDWLLELGDDEICPGDYEGIDKPGTILVSAQGIMIRAGGDGKHVRPAYFDLERFSLSSRSPSVGDTVLVREWQIWLTEAERTRVGSQPFFEYPASATFEATFA